MLSRIHERQQKGRAVEMSVTEASLAETENATPEVPSEVSEVKPRSLRPMAIGAAVLVVVGGLSLGGVAWADSAAHNDAVARATAAVKAVKNGTSTFASNKKALDASAKESSATAIAALDFIDDAHGVFPEDQLTALQSASKDQVTGVTKAGMVFLQLDPLPKVKASESTDDLNEDLRQLKDDESQIASAEADITSADKLITKSNAAEIAAATTLASNAPQVASAQVAANSAAAQSAKDAMTAAGDTASKAPVIEQVASLRAVLTQLTALKQAQVVGTSAQSVAAAAAASPTSHSTASSASKGSSSTRSTSSGSHSSSSGTSGSSSSSGSTSSGSSSSSSGSSSSGGTVDTSPSAAVFTANTIAIYRSDGLGYVALSGSCGSSNYGHTYGTGVSYNAQEGPYLKGLSLHWSFSATKIAPYEYNWTYYVCP